MKKIDIIILHYGDLSVTKKCIQSLETHAKGYRDIILINNDPSLDLAKEIKPKKKRNIINANKNLGFAAGVNIGIQNALLNNADAVCLLNNDVLVTKDFIEGLSTALFSKNEIGIVGTVIEFLVDGNKMYDHGAMVNLKTGISKHRNYNKVLHKKPQQVDSISGCCMMIKKEVIEAIGYFDERFFMYYEDVDFCLRAKAQGFSTYIVPSEVIYHELSKSIGRKSSRLVYQLVKSNIRFSKKHSEFPQRYLSVATQILKFSIKMPYHIAVIGKAIKDA
jgi:GT2 family glycosyltransferase